MLVQRPHAPWVSGTRPPWTKVEVFAGGLCGVEAVGNPNRDERSFCHSALRANSLVKKFAGGSGDQLIVQSLVEPPSPPSNLSSAPAHHVSPPTPRQSQTGVCQTPISMNPWSRNPGAWTRPQEPDGLIPFATTCASVRLGAVVQQGFHSPFIHYQTTPGHPLLEALAPEFRDLPRLPTHRSVRGSQFALLLQRLISFRRLVGRCASGIS